MLMADTMAIFFVILGMMLALPGLWLLCRGLWPRVVANAEQRCGNGLIKPFVAGLPITAMMIFIAIALGNLGPVGKMSAAAVVCFYLIFASCGVAGLITGIGKRLGSPIDVEQPLRATLRGGIVLELSFLLPILGWFVILPASFTIGCGAACIALLGGAFASSNAPTLNAEAANYQPTQTFGAGR